ncbi:uncharacterized protein LOC6586609 [Drosophila mojavensis]|uniref:Lipocalin/cytosolic fatty-acid binding domain-containing protein n=1 Tax=Drosophila mojavensis TaxID=7230 RepID=B4L9H6_DROMO|nr:uncharacterized protein LOC6586609 [Drosophila mojavensis]EDW17351.2 uncharacterized protein Dmoj_GI16852 [Drosophila mojavensis]
MLLKSGFFVIFGVCWSHALANNLDHYVYGSMDGTTSTERINAAVRCINVKPQSSVDLQQIMGLWYGSEIIMHSQDFPGVYEYDSCVIIHLTDVTDQVQASYNNNYGYNGYYNNRQQNQNNYRTLTSTPTYQEHDNEYNRRAQQQNMRYLRLVWSERDNNLEYTFNYTANAPNVWSNVGDQRGSLATLNSYTQFTGTVQVGKAVNDHLVLTFCGNDVKSSIYTVVLTRNRLGLSNEELRSVHNMLSRRGLSTETIRKVCSGSARLIVGLPALLLLLLLPLLAGRGRCH